MDREKNILKNNTKSCKCLKNKVVTGIKEGNKMKNKTKTIHLEEGQEIIIVSGGQKIKITNSENGITHTWVTAYGENYLINKGNRSVHISGHKGENYNPKVTIHNIKPFTKRTIKSGNLKWTDLKEEGEKYDSFCGLIYKK